MSSLRFPPLALALAGALIAAGPGHAQPPKRSASHDVCFRPGDAYSWASVGDRIVNLKVNLRDYYQLTLQGICPNIDWNQAIAIRNRSGGGWICSPLDAEIISPSPAGPPQHCEVAAIRKLTPEEVKALGRNEKP